MALPPRYDLPAAPVRAQAYAPAHMVVIRTHRHPRGRGAEPRIAGGFERLTPETAIAHITGIPFLWAVELILERAPNLKTLQVIPSMLVKIHGRHRALCAARGVTIAGGHCRPELAWDEDEVSRSRTYEPQRRFMAELKGEQRSLFDELMAMGFESATMASRYFCLDGEPRVSLRTIGDLYGFKTGETLISAHVQAVLRYLDPGFETGLISNQRARTMAASVGRLRPMLQSAQLLQERMDAAGIERLPDGFPLSRFDVLVELVAAKRDGRLQALAKKWPAVHEALLVRFGLKGESRYRTLVEVGAALNGGVSRERARQLEEKGLAMLEISEGDSMTHNDGSNP